MTTTPLSTIRAIQSLDDPDADLFLTIRSLLADDDDDLPTPAELTATIRDAIHALDTQSLSQLRLEYSLCPMHLCDYATCFDDDDPDCATIRAYFPDHDT